ncbi:MAG: hypothetical protein IIC80_11575 [Chloroflexi bacterium]|nr:hypothetical protein [Chloroflexota bacterium]
MPITRRQFELGILPETEWWMEELYDFFLEHEDQAFSIGDLRESFRLGRHVAPAKASALKERRHVDAALETLFKVGAIHGGYVKNKGEVYYLFKQPVEKGTWKIKESSKSA